MKPLAKMSDIEVREFLKSSNLVESLQETNQREQALKKVDASFRQWLLHNVSTKSDSPTACEDDCSPSPDFKLLTLGSYELGIQNPGGDIDILIIVTNHVERSDLFQSFGEAVVEICDSREMCHKVTKTYVPVIKTTIDGIDIDFSFAKLPTPVILSEDELMNDICLKDMDLESVRSLNGWRDLIYIKKLIGNRLDNYKVLLKILKFWATRRGIYNNSIGYFSGMALMVLLAQVFKEGGKTSEIKDLLQSFFQKYSTWNWPRPVMLCHNEANTPDAPILQVWNPQRYSFDKDHRMPILTPAYPQRNAAFTVSMSTRKVILIELARGYRVLSQMKAGTAVIDVLRELTLPQEMLLEMPYLTCILLSTKSSGTSLRDHLNWCSVVRSQIRKLVSELELDVRILTLYPFANSFPQMNADQPGCHVNQWVIAVEGEGDVTELLEESISDFKDNVHKYAEDHNISEHGRSVAGSVLRTEDWKTQLPTGLDNGISGFTTLSEYKKGFFSHNT